MKKFCDVICLLIWGCQLGMGIHWMSSGTPVNHILYLLAVAVCVLHYFGELLRGSEDD